jgi:hypothetical protein
MVEHKWEEVQGESGWWNPTKEGEKIEGYIKDLVEKDFGIQATISNVGVPDITTPSHRVLQNKLKSCKLGDYVQITFEKEELPTIKGKNGTKLYSIKRRVVQC